MTSHPMTVTTYNGQRGETACTESEWRSRHGCDDVTRDVDGGARVSGASVDRLTGESRASHRYTPQHRARNELSFNESTTNYYYLIHHTHTHTHPFNGPMSGTTRVSRYQVCTSLQTDNHASTSPLLDTPPCKIFHKSGRRWSNGWRRGVVVSGLRRMNEVNARRARLVPGWVTVFGPVYHLGM